MDNEDEASRMKTNCHGNWSSRKDNRVSVIILDMLAIYVGNSMNESSLRIWMTQVLVIA